jgi:hypothetical protein
MLNFFLAYQYCRSIAMELVSLENAEEAIALSEYLRSGQFISTVTVPSSDLY